MYKYVFKNYNVCKISSCSCKSVYTLNYLECLCINMYLDYIVCYLSLCLYTFQFFFILVESVLTFFALFYCSLSYIFKYAYHIIFFKFKYLYLFNLYLLIYFLTIKHYMYSYILLLCSLTIFHCIH